MGYVIERPLEPPENTSRVAFKCEICEDPIYEGEDYYDIPNLGYCCVACISGCKCYDAEADDNSDEAYEAMREEELFNE